MRNAGRVRREGQRRSGTCSGSERTAWACSERGSAISCTWKRSSAAAARKGEGSGQAGELELRPRLRVRVVPCAREPTAAARAVQRTSSAPVVDLGDLSGRGKVRGPELRPIGSHPLPARPRDVQIDTGIVPVSAAATLVKQATAMTAAPRPVDLETRPVATVTATLT